MQRQFSRISALLLLTGLCLPAGCRKDPPAPPPVPPVKRPPPVPGTPSYLQRSPDWPGPPVVDPSVPLAQVPGGDKIFTEYAKAVVSPTEKGYMAVDPATRQIMWRAYTCNAPECAAKSKEKPLLFSIYNPDLSVDSSGHIQGPPNYKDPDLLRICPVCRRGRTVVEYFEPATAARREELFAELEEARALLIEAERSGTSPPPGTRMPDEIAREISNLPAVFLLRNP